MVEALFVFNNRLKGYFTKEKVIVLFTCDDDGKRNCKENSTDYGC